LALGLGLGVQIRILCRLADANTASYINDMNIDESDTENIVIHQDEGGGRKPGAQPTRSGGKQSTLDSAFTLDRRVRGEEEDGDNGYTRVTRRATRSTSSLMNTRVAKKATPIKPIIRVMGDEVREAAQASRADQLSFLHRLVESVLRQLQEQQETQAKAQKESAVEAAELRKVVEKQGRIIDALYALSEERVRKPPTYSQVAWTGIT
jgi:hypothetical protein